MDLRASPCRLIWFLSPLRQSRYAVRYTGRSRCPLPAPRQPDGAMGKEEQVSTTKVSSEGLANQSIQSLSTQTQTIQRV